MKIEGSIACKPTSLMVADNKKAISKPAQDSTALASKAQVNKKNQPSMEETLSSVEKANKMLFKNNTHLKFEINDESERVIVSIIDDQTGEVVKEIPDEDFVEMMHKLCEIAGILVDERC